jgi:PleD family two-component response regulator
MPMTGKLFSSLPPNDSIGDGAGRHGRLGLAGIREREERLGGEMAIDSVGGRGTRIHVQLPAEIIGPHSPELEAGDSAVSSKRIRVLFADDHPIVRDGFAAMIAAERDMVSIGEMETGEQAIELFRKLKPDVAVMDLKLPGMDSLSAHQKWTTSALEK